MQLRIATPADAAAIAHVQIEGWRTAYRGLVADAFLDELSHETRTAQWTENLKQPAQLTWVVTDPDVVAFANSGPERTGRADYRGELYAIYVLDARRRAGIGRQLFQQTVQSFLDAGVENMLLWAFADNPYRRFYERLGGKLIDRQVIEIEGQRLNEVAYGWEDLARFLRTPIRSA